MPHSFGKHRRTLVRGQSAESFSPWVLGRQAPVDEQSAGVC